MIVLDATVLAYAVGADALVSADAAFSTIANIRHVNPDANGIRYLLGHDVGDQPWWWRAAELYAGAADSALTR